MQIDRTVAKSISADAENALKAVADKYGLTLNQKGGSFDGTNLNVKFVFTAVGNDGVAETTGRKALKAYYPELALKAYYPELVNCEVVLRSGLKGKVVEYHSRKRQYPFIVEATNGKMFKMSESDVNRQKV